MKRRLAWRSASWRSRREGSRTSAMVYLLCSQLQHSRE
jgi:hypothetical protein